MINLFYVYYTCYFSEIVIMVNKMIFILYNCSLSPNYVTFTSDWSGSVQEV